MLLDAAELWLERGEHVSLVGPNGAGKTTLIETLAGRRPLGEAPPGGGPLVAGKLRTGHNVKIGYLSQHAEELHAGNARTVLEAAGRLTGLTPGKARALLGRFLFSGEEAEKPLDGLSGGERRRLSLAILVHSGANVLILDEPTNHLDLESREALEQALGEFQGSLLLVSHDRALLDAVGSRTVAFEEGTLRSYVGGWPEYVRVREERAAAARAKPSAPAKPAARPGSAEAGGAPRRWPKVRPGARAARSAGSSRRSRPPRRRCAPSRTSSPTRRPGPMRRAHRDQRRPPRAGQAGRGGALPPLGAGGRGALNCTRPQMLHHVRNIAIVLLIAAVVVIVPGGGTGANVLTQAVSLAFLAALAWFASSCTASTATRWTRSAIGAGPSSTSPPAWPR